MKPSVGVDDRAAKSETIFVQVFLKEQSCGVRHPMEDNMDNHIPKLYGIERKLSKEAP